MDQQQILKKMSGLKRLEQAFSLSDFTLELAIRNIKENLGKKTNLQLIKKELRKRLGRD